MKINSVLSGAFLALVSTTAGAATVEFTASGTFSSSSTSEIAVGDSFSLSLVFDDGISDGFAAFPDIGLYSFTPDALSSFSINGTGFSVGPGTMSINDNSVSSTDLVNAGFSGNGQVLGSDTIDSFNFLLQGDETTFSGKSLDVLDSSFSSTSFSFVLNGTGLVAASGSFSSTSYGPLAAVPLPATGILLFAGLGGLVASRRLRKSV